MTPYQLEELENIRRAAERGKKMAELSEESRLGIRASRYYPLEFVDVFVHILDQVDRIKNNND